MDSIPGQLDTIRCRLDDGAKRMDRFDSKLKELKAGQDELTKQMVKNTMVTEEVLDVVRIGKLGTYMIKWIASISVAGTAIWTAIYWMTHGGALPPK